LKRTLFPLLALPPARAEVTLRVLFGVSDTTASTWDGALFVRAVFGGINIIDKKCPPYLRMNSALPS
jgi:hypothetical protein